MRPILPQDYSRCMGISPECPQRAICARHRDLPPNEVLSWVHHLNPEPGQPCPYFLEYQ